MKTGISFTVKCLSALTVIVLSILCFLLADNDLAESAIHVMASLLIVLFFYISDVKQQLLHLSFIAICAVLIEFIKFLLLQMVWQADARLRIALDTVFAVVLYCAFSFLVIKMLTDFSVSKRVTMTVKRVLILLIISLIAGLIIYAILYKELNIDDFSAQNTQSILGFIQLFTPSWEGLLYYKVSAIYKMLEHITILLLIAIAKPSQDKNMRGKEARF